MTVYEIPVAARDAVIARRMLRSLPAPEPRDVRPSRARRERLAPELRHWGPKHANPLPAQAG